MIKNAEKLITLAQKQYEIICSIFDRRWGKKVRLYQYKDCMLKDILDLQMFYEFILDDNFTKAQSWGRDLDTEVRSLIPTYICINLLEAERL